MSSTTLNNCKIDVDLSDGHEQSASTHWTSADVQLQMDTEKPGKHHGHLSIPLPGTHSIASQHRIPVCVIRGHNPGPTVTLIAGIHGDEHEGSLTLNRLAREITAEALHGTLFLLPAVNIKGLQQGTRHNPLDGKNIDYEFPGSSTGTPSERLAYEITYRFIEPAELVIDLRSGGKDIQFIPSVAVRFADTSELSKKSEACMIAFGAPNSLRLPPSSVRSCLQSTAQAMQKQYIQTEIGAGTVNSVLSLSIAHRGCMNVLRHKGMLKQELELASTRILEVRDSSYYVFAATSAYYEPMIYPGENVSHDEPMGMLMPLNDTSKEAISVLAPRSACLLATHSGGFVHEGQLISILAEEVQA